MNDNCDQQAIIDRLAKLIKEIDCGMLTTVDEKGRLHSRPMSLNGHVECDGTMWFFTYGKSHKVLEAQTYRNVNVSFSDVHNNKYASVSGTAHVVRDKKKIEKYWKPELKAWFPDGTETEDIALLRIEAHQAELWDEPATLVAETIAFIQALAGQPVSMGTNLKINL